MKVTKEKKEQIKENMFEIFERIALLMNSTLNSQRLLEIILDSCIKFTGAISGSIKLLDKKTQMLNIMVARGLGKDVRQKVRLKVGEGVTGWAVKHKKSVMIGDVSQDPRYVRVKDYLQSELVAPLIVDKEVIGVISVDSDRKNAFTEEHLRLMEVVANQAAQVIKKTKAYETLKRQNQRQQILLAIADIISTTLDLNECFTQIMQILNQHLSLRRGTLVLHDPKSDELVITASIGLTEEEKARGRYKIGEGITGRVVETGKPVAVKDISSDPRFLDRTGARREEIKKRKKISFFCVPLRLQNRVIGALSADKLFQSDEQFNEDLDFLAIVASHIAQAVHIQQLRDEHNQQLINENIILRQQLKDRYRYENIVGESPAMEKVFHLMDMVAQSRAPVLILGESGTGKELVARAIHHHSPRAPKPFMAINCAAIPEQLLESELFGYVRGAFTGAFSDKKGLFQLADGGTVFLDEIAEMSPHLQAKLLRVLQDQVITPLGTHKNFKVDVRIIAATNKDLVQEIKKGRFREDLYYRLNVVEIPIPPLRARKEDIPPLIAYFLKRYNEQYGKNVTQITPEAMNLMLKYSWPGNARELQNCIERAVIMTSNGIISAEVLPPAIRETSESKEPEGGESVALPLEEVRIFNILRRYFTRRLAEEQVAQVKGQGADKENLWQEIITSIERLLLESALEVTGNNKSRAANLLGIDRNTLRAKLEA
ncbi:MAG: sigma 54-interacting transcriptional regulator [Candidatus Sumerlaeia bacterium]|nr:sigma 54-interacting transcriptional regulator [Candidatus Sumerlaeia bacterium]